MEVKIYCDSGADITCLKEFFSVCTLYQYPYDSADHRNKKLIKKGVIKLARPSSKTPWENLHSTWDESDFTWDEPDSLFFTDLEKLIYQNSKKNKQKLFEDVLHLDSACMTGCNIFITSDKHDIVSKRVEIEGLCGMKVFWSHKESEELIKYIQSLLIINSMLSSGINVLK